MRDVATDFEKDAPFVAVDRASLAALPPGKQRRQAIQRYQPKDFNVIGTLDVERVCFLEDCSILQPQTPAEIRDYAHLYTRTCVPAMGVHSQRIFGLYPYVGLWDPFTGSEQTLIGVELVHYAPQREADQTGSGLGTGIFDPEPGFNELPRPHWNVHFFFDELPVDICRETEFLEPDPQYRPYTGFGNNVNNPT